MADWAEEFLATENVATEQTGDWVADFLGSDVGAEPTLSQESTEPDRTPMQDTTLGRLAVGAGGVAGGIAGGVMGTAAGPVGTGVGAIGGAALGASGTEAWLQNLDAWMSGDTSAYDPRAIAQSGVQAGTMQGFGGAAGALGGKVLGSTIRGTNKLVAKATDTGLAKHVTDLLKNPVAKGIGGAAAFTQGGFEGAAAALITKYAGKKLLQAMVKAGQNHVKQEQMRAVARAFGQAHSRAPTDQKKTQLIQGLLVALSNITQPEQENVQIQEETRRRRLSTGIRF